MPEYAAMAARVLALVSNHYTDATKCRTPEFNDSGKNPWFRFERDLQAHGFTVLGTGHFSCAVEHPDLPGLAIKIGLKKEDSGAAYAAWARSKQGVYKSVPRILHIQRGAQAYVVIMPKYSDFGYDATTEQDNQFLQAMRVLEQGDEVAVPAMLNKDLVLCAMDIRKFFDGIAEFDLHRGNVMLDDEGNIIITDPVSFTHGMDESP